MPSVSIKAPLSINLAEHLAISCCLLLSPMCSLKSVIAPCSLTSSHVLQVNFAAQSEFECLANYRILQRGHSEMTKSKLLEWWRLIADEDRAWELLAAMRTAVIGALALEYEAFALTSSASLSVEHHERTPHSLIAAQTLADWMLTVL